MTNSINNTAQLLEVFDNEWYPQLAYDSRLIYQETV